MQFLTEVTRAHTLARARDTHDDDAFATDGLALSGRHLEAVFRHRHVLVDATLSVTAQHPAHLVIALR